jgi:hypothetical protein
MNINNNFTPLAWHQGNIELQSNRATYAYGHVVPLFASATTLIPFQIITATGAVDTSIVDMRLLTIDGTDAVGENLYGRMRIVKNHIASRDVDVIIYNGTALNPALPIGQYYLTLKSGTQMWYSDVMTIVADATKLTRITWWDEVDLEFNAGIIKYRVIVPRVGAEQYKNVMYFMEELGMPEYTQEEEGETRDGLFYASKLISGKKYKMQIAQLTEAMCDALRFVHLSDNVEVRDGYLRTYYCDSVLVTPEWQTGAVASAAVEITTDTFVKAVGTGYEGDSPVPSGDTSVIGDNAIIGVNFFVGNQQ